MAYAAVAVVAVAAGILAGRALTTARAATRAAADFNNAVRDLRDYIDRKNVAIDRRLHQINDDRFTEVNARLDHLERTVAELPVGNDPNTVIASMKDFAQSILYGPGRADDTGNTDGLIVDAGRQTSGDLYTTPDWTDELIDTGVDLAEQFPPPPDLEGER